MWAIYGFNTAWKRACAATEATGLTFHDLRGTAVIRLAIEECSEVEIVTITGHSLKDVGSISDTHYLHRDSRLADSAIRKPEQNQETPK